VIIFFGGHEDPPGDTCVWT